MEKFFQNHWELIVLFLPVVSHLLHTLPPIHNAWLRWLVGGIQYFVGLREQAGRTFQNGNGAKTGQLPAVTTPTPPENPYRWGQK